MPPAPKLFGVQRGKTIKPAQVIHIPSVAIGVNPKVINLPVPANPTIVMVGPADPGIRRVIRQVYIPIQPPAVGVMETCLLELIDAQATVPDEFAGWVGAACVANLGFIQYTTGAAPIEESSVPAIDVGPFVLGPGQQLRTTTIIAPTSVSIVYEDLVMED